MDRTGALSVGEVAKRSGVAVSTLHFYETKGLISSTRSSSNQRRYDRKVLRRIAVIRIAQSAGLPLHEIKSHLDILPNNAITAKEWKELSHEWHAMLTKRIETLTTLRDKMEGCIGCGCLSLKDCPLRNPDDELAKAGPGPQLLGSD